MVRQTISRHDAIQLISRARAAVAEPAALQDLLEDYQASTVFEALREEYAGVGNGFLSQVCETISGLRLEVIGEPEARLPCPCCHRRTLDELHDTAVGTGYDICDHCNWEDDGTSNEQSQSGVNHGSMAEYMARMSTESNYHDREKWRK
jgi:cysteine-rich CPCC protein